MPLSSPSPVLLTPEQPFICLVALSIHSSTATRSRLFGQFESFQISTFACCSPLLPPISLPLISSRQIISKPSTSPFFCGIEERPKHESNLSFLTTNVSALTSVQVQTTSSSLVFLEADVQHRAYWTSRIFERTILSSYNIKLPVSAL